MYSQLMYCINCPNGGAPLRWMAEFNGTCDNVSMTWRIILSLWNKIILYKTEDIEGVIYQK